MAIPFLFELRTAIDWTWTDTSMPLFDFFNMENFYATIYNLKCARTFETVRLFLHILIYVQRRFFSGNKQCQLDLKHAEYSLFIEENHFFP